MTAAVHRLVEQQAAARPDAAAIAGGRADGGRTLTYRDLNGSANTLARRLKESGLARGALAYVRMPRCTDLAVVLLAVLKAGAAYVWVEPGSETDLDLPASFCVAPGANGAAPLTHRWMAIDIAAALRECAHRPGPNLPVLTRGSDIACVLPDAAGRPHLLVPHATITALTHKAAPPTGAAPATAAGALDLWVGLTSGATLTFDVARSSSAAA